MSNLTPLLVPAETALLGYQIAQMECGTTQCKVQITFLA